VRIMEEPSTAEYRTNKANDGAFRAQHFFGKHPKASRWSPAHEPTRTSGPEPRRHDPHKVYALMRRRWKHKGQPTVISPRHQWATGWAAGPAKNRRTS